MKTVLVTGASGFTGEYMVKALRAEGYHVVGTGHGTSEADETIHCDLTQQEQVAELVQQVKPQLVVHLAALSFVGHSRPAEFYQVNVIGTMNLLEALAGLPDAPEKVLIASSANIYGTPDVGQIQETVCPAPVNHYACSKLAMEHMVATWFSRLPIVVVRPFNYTGPGQGDHFLIPKIVSHFARGEAVIELGNTEVSRDFSDVRDVVAAYRQLLASDAHSTMVNICSGEPRSLGSIIQQMSDVAGYEIEVRVNPAFVRKNEIPVLVGSPEKLESLIGPQSRHDFQNTLEAMYQHYRTK